MISGTTLFLNSQHFSIIFQLHAHFPSFDPNEPTIVTHLFCRPRREFSRSSNYHRTRIFFGKNIFICHFFFVLFMQFVYIGKNMGKMSHSHRQLLQSTVHSWPSVFARVRQAAAISPFSACKQRTCLQWSSCRSSASSCH